MACRRQIKVYMILGLDEGKGSQEDGVKELSQITTAMLVMELKPLSEFGVQTDLDEPPRQVNKIQRVRAEWADPCVWVKKGIKESWQFLCPGSPGQVLEAAVVSTMTSSVPVLGETTLMGTVLYGEFKTPMGAGVTTFSEQHTNCVTPS